MARVLVIDDGRTIRDVLVNLLAESGHQAAAAASADAGLAYATSHPLDLVITDMFVPEHDGFDAMERFRKCFPKVKVVALSGSGWIGQQPVLDLARCLSAETIEKPISLQRLNEVVDRVLDHVEPGRRRPFLPLELAPPGEVQAMHQRLIGTPMLVETLDALPGIVLLLNAYRQAVFTNRAALRRLGFANRLDVVGRRAGELMGCAHADDNACGSTEFCRYCGAGHAMASALRGEAAEHECRIMPAVVGGDLDLRVTAQPFVAGEDELLLLSVTDIADEKRREALEAIFFHDVLNTAGGIRGLTQLMKTVPADEQPPMQDALATLSETLVEEIALQRDLTQAEQGELAVAPELLEAHRVLETVAAHYSGHPVAAGKDIVVEPAAAPIAFVADPTIVGRVLGNMVKNALEAVAIGQTIRLRASGDGDKVRLEVWNSGVMPQSAQRQVFERSFSTKGAARGLGTYGMRLLTERYLGGRVWFESDREHDTRFIVEMPLGA